jgi:hypothetical protein
VVVSDAGAGVLAVVKLQTRVQVYACDETVFAVQFGLFVHG